MDANSTGECSSVPTAAAQLRRIREGEHGMLISVDDSGAGIAADKLDRIFERGFSTKGEGRGTGLSLVKETVDAFHGTIRVESEPGIGSSFIITVAESANRQQ